MKQCLECGEKIKEGEFCKNKKKNCEWKWRKRLKEEREKYE